MSTTPSDQTPPDPTHTDPTPPEPTGPEPTGAVDPAEAAGPATPTAYPDPTRPVVLDRTTLRRAPRFGRFALVGVLGGLVVGVVVGLLTLPTDHPGWSRAVLAFEIMLVVLLVTLLGALVADARSRRRR